MSTMKMRATYAMACIPLVVFRFQTDRGYPFSFDFIVPWEAVEFEILVHPFFMITAPHDAFKGHCLHEYLKFAFVARHEQCLRRLIDLPRVPRATPSVSVRQILCYA